MFISAFIKQLTNLPECAIVFVHKIMRVCVCVRACVRACMRAFGACNTGILQMGTCVHCAMSDDMLTCHVRVLHGFVAVAWSNVVHATNTADQ